jgi:hypothetical protein
VLLEIPTGNLHQEYYPFSLQTMIFYISSITSCTLYQSRSWTLGYYTGPSPEIHRGLDIEADKLATDCPIRPTASVYHVAPVIGVNMVLQPTWNNSPPLDGSNLLWAELAISGPQLFSYYTALGQTMLLLHIPYPY